MTRGSVYTLASTNGDYTEVRPLYYAKAWLTLSRTTVFHHAEYIYKQELTDLLFSVQKQVVQRNRNRHNPHVRYNKRMHHSIRSCVTEVQSKLVTWMALLFLWELISRPLSLKYNFSATHGKLHSFQ